MKLLTLRPAAALAFLLTLLSFSEVTLAQQRADVLFDGHYSTLGVSTVARDVSVDPGWVPLNDEVAFVYDPEFYFFLRGSLSASQYDRTAEFSDYGYVVVGAAGDPGGYYSQTPSWITHLSFDTSFDEVSSEVSIAYSYGTTYVPTLRGFQSYVVYSNLENLSADELLVYSDSLSFGADRYLLTGDGQEVSTSVDFTSSEAAVGSAAIELHTESDAGTGSHYKLMLFANGDAAGFSGIDLSGYSKLSFRAKASRNVVLQGAFGTQDDSASKGLGALTVTTEYQTFTLDVSDLDLTDVNTLLWLYVHKAHNAFDWSGLSVYLDDIKLIAE